MPDSNSSIIRTLPELISCPDCDLLIDADIPAIIGASIRCPRCDTELFRVRIRNFERPLAFTSTALILFLIANAFPIVGLNILYATLGVVLMFTAYRIIDVLTPQVDFAEELKKGNVAVGLFVAAIFISVAIVVGGALN